MTLAQAYLITGIIFAIPGIGFLLAGDKSREPILAVLRSFPAAILTFGSGAAWFLWNIKSLSESDLAGFPRNLLLGVFGSAALLAFYYTRDQLAARGIGILLILSAQIFLTAGFMQQPQNLFLSITSYLFIICGGIWGIQPYRLRNSLARLLANPLRARIFGSILTIYAANLIFRSI